MDIEEKLVPERKPDLCDREHLTEVEVCHWPQTFRELIAKQDTRLCDAEMNQHDTATDPCREGNPLMPCEGEVP